ncbi:MAG: hypothetical protein LLF99_16095 [Desulfobacteraceae bacterium]|nr:hypothetical protein [Desulfobacteraceae bacterium]
MNEEPPLSQYIRAEILRNYEKIIAEFKQNLADCEHDAIGASMDRLLQKNGLTLDPQSYSYRKLYRELLKARIGIFEVLKKREVGDYQDEQPSSAPFSPTLLSPADSEPSELFSTVMQKYIAEQERGGKWTEKSKLEVSKSLELIMNLLGDIPVNSITRAMMNDCKENLLKLPTNMGKMPQYRGKTVQEILQMDIEKPMSVSNVNKQLDRASSLFNWARINGFMDRNPAERIQVSVKTREDEDRNAFSKGDLDKLFSSPSYLECTHRQSYQFWIPILGLFTGARLDELCQLHLDDIRDEEGVWLLDINDKDEKKLKNKSSRRVIPLHPFLAHELKLPQYAEKLRAQGHDRLFPVSAPGVNVSKSAE